MRLIRKIIPILGGIFTSADFTYTGTYTWVDDGSGNWRIKFLTSGTLIITSGTISVDVLCVGGGGGSIYPNNDYTYGCGGGGYTKTYTGIVLQANISYSVVIGAGGSTNSNGGTTWIVSSGAYYANGGGVASQVPTGTTAHVTTGGAGGSGGAGIPSIAGGQDGAAGANYAWIGQYWRFGGAGQGTTTKEFGESTGTLYARGGGSGTPVNANTGNGGNNYDSPGCSGICVIRNHRSA